MDAADFFKKSWVAFPQVTIMEQSILYLTRECCFINNKRS